ncbi:MAG: hypothetical protein EA391_12365 [Balneolaceae bacterium]|nr:MAG: hypothetical protein EA391_12365 [Balneolaceae bacterium]
MLIHVVLLFLILDDKRKGKIRLPYMLAFELMLSQQTMMHFATEWDWWRALMDLFSGVSY